MILKVIEDEDLNNYYLPSMVLGFPLCTFKCEKEINEQVCQNGALAQFPDKNFEVNQIIQRYLNNGITHAIVCAGLEPFDSWNELYDFIKAFREKNTDDIVIYTGYYKSEISNEIHLLSQFPNIIVKFGRYIPRQEKHFDNVLGVFLASNNQYAEKIS